MSKVTYEVVGRGHISERTEAEDGSITRRSILCGHFVDGVFVPNDLAGEPEEVITLAASEWAPEVLEQYAQANKPTSPQKHHKLYKSTLIRRLTEAEAVTLTALLDASPVKSKMLWQASDFLVSSDPLFANLQQAIGGALGEKRAAEILAAD